MRRARMPLHNTESSVRVAMHVPPPQQNRRQYTVYTTFTSAQIFLGGYFLCTYRAYLLSYAVFLKPQNSKKAEQ